MTYRVIQWSTGNVGAHTFASIMAHPDARARGPLGPLRRQGRAGTRPSSCGLAEPTGVLATNDADALLASTPTSSVYTATGDLRPTEAVADMCRILESGKNVVSRRRSSRLIYPPTAPRGLGPPARSRVPSRATRRASPRASTPASPTTCCPLVASGFSRAHRLDPHRREPRLLHLHATRGAVRHDGLRHSRSITRRSSSFPARSTFAWGGVLHMIAAGLGEEIEEIREVVERCPAPHDFDTAVGPISGRHDGRTAVRGAGLRSRPAGDRGRARDAHASRRRARLARDPSGSGGYRITVEGSPTYTLDFEMMGEDGDHNTGGLVATGMRHHQRDPRRVRRAARRALDPRPAPGDRPRTPELIRDPVSSATRPRARWRRSRAGRAGAAARRATSVSGVGVETSVDDRVDHDPIAACDLARRVARRPSRVPDEDADGVVVVGRPSRSTGPDNAHDRRIPPWRDRAPETDRRFGLHRTTEIDTRRRRRGRGPLGQHLRHRDVDRPVEHETQRALGVVGEHQRPPCGGSWGPRGPAMRPGGVRGSRAPSSNRRTSPGRTDARLRRRPRRRAASRAPGARPTMPRPARRAPGPASRAGARRG